MCTMWLNKQREMETEGLREMEKIHVNPIKKT